ncbi:zinc finger Y-chromosomal protein 1-like [Tropilaelaps mercedesae]|uniref:Zinc finger Y-chromosomal protein 1-like n=1 Tax=Tropilaelaps mercedesae TaxID=418985 RepID=A0A1V9XXY9_9ACAR|nr:zinc finger Y-chromosomal protein 1-like [Tropilaelaps mercedesae]
MMTPHPPSLRGWRLWRADIPYLDLDGAGMNEFGRYKCPYAHCPYITNRRFPLSRHLLTHTGEKPFQCAYCHYSCSRKDALSSHMARRHPHTLVAGADIVASVGLLGGSSVGILDESDASANDYPSSRILS